MFYSIPLWSIFYFLNIIFNYIYYFIYYFYYIFYYRVYIFYVLILCSLSVMPSIKGYSRLSIIWKIILSMITIWSVFLFLTSYRILSIPVMCRYDCANEETGCAVGKLFGHPNILYLPSKLSGVLLYETVDRVISCNVSYSIILTDGQVSTLHVTCNLLECWTVDLWAALILSC